MSNAETRVARVEADGVDVFYRESGAEHLPIVLLLHGFPSSSFQYRHLIHSLAHTGKYRVIAPDPPGFGFTVIPESRNYSYSFDALKTTVTTFLDALKIQKFSTYVFYYGAPIAFRYVLYQWPA
jgi:pimeloyl-ACP methyl ester carboxylesterase